MIKKSMNIGFLKIFYRIEDGVVVLTTNQPLLTKEIFNLSKKNRRDVSWNDRLKACIERYPGKTEEEIEKTSILEVEDVYRRASELNTKGSGERK